MFNLHRCHFLLIFSVALCLFVVYVILSIHLSHDVLTVGTCDAIRRWSVFTWYRDEDQRCVGPPGSGAGSRSAPELRWRGRRKGIVCFGLKKRFCARLIFPGADPRGPEGGVCLMRWVRYTGRAQSSSEPYLYPKRLCLWPGSGTPDRTHGGLQRCFSLSCLLQ